MIIDTSVVVGLLFGDEGKGATTDRICAQSIKSGITPIVVRFSGGPQAGHTVYHNGNKHVFGSFGSGTFRGAITYWSRFCAFSPTAFIRERKKLRELSAEPNVVLDTLSPVITPYDVLWNRRTEKTNNHGSCGMGVGATFERNEGPHKLYVQDFLLPDSAFSEKLESIKSYYDRKGLTDVLPLTTWSDFHNAIMEVKRVVMIYSEKSFFDALRAKGVYHVIFEGSQGVLLDMDFGIFPNVTRSNTTSKNAMTIIHDNGLRRPTVHYVTRTYTTRHGNGWMPDAPVTLKNTEAETNVTNEWQGTFKKSALDEELLLFALVADNNFSSSCEKRLTVTCADQCDVPFFIHDIVNKAADLGITLVDKITVTRHSSQIQEITTSNI